MKLKSLASLVIAIALAGCVSTNPPNPPNTPTNVLQCVAQDSFSIVQGLIPDVENALVRSDAFIVLKGILEKVGKSALDCAVAEVVRMSHIRAEAAPGSAPLSTLKIKNGEAWLTRSAEGSK